MPVASIYLDGSYAAANPGWHADDSAVKAKWVHGLLQRNSISAARCAEIGCGAGGVIDALQMLSPEMTGVGFDVSPQAIEMAKSRARPGLTFSVKDVANQPPIEVFDVALVIDVIEHVPDYIDFVRRVRATAEFKVFHIPLDMSAQGLIRGTLTATRRKLGHLHYFSKDTALATLQDCGHQVIDWAYTDGSKELPNRRAITKAANVARSALELVDKDFAAAMLGGYSLLALTK